MRFNIKNWILNLMLVITGLLFALVIAEVSSRLFFSISPGAQKRSVQDGQEVRDWVKPGTVYRQLSSEYDAITTITHQGHRVPEVDDNPEIVFLGDSFTFGQGLSDEETFPYIYSRTLKISCANLAIPGIGTVEELDILKRYLENWHWRPKEVKLFILAMSTSFFAGNDLTDNFFYFNNRKEIKNNCVLLLKNEKVVKRAKLASGFMEKIFAYREKLLRHSNLLRLIKFQLGPLLKSKLVYRLDQHQLTEALIITANQLNRLDKLSQKYGFKYQIYLLHPVQDLIGKTHEQTLKKLNKISPASIQGTAQLFLDVPQKHYYSYDGHFNALGSRKIAEFLISLDKS